MIAHHRWLGLALTLTLIAPARAEPPAGEAGGVLVGELRERGTRAPVAGMPVVVRDARGHEVEVLSDGDGRFEVRELALGSLRVEVFGGGYEPFDAIVEARPDAAAAEAALYVVRLEPSGAAQQRTVVTAPFRHRGAGVITLARPELEGVAGTAGDPTRVVTALPGVARPLLGLGDVAVRGADPEHTGFFVDGHPTPYLYHLLAGPSVLDPGLVSDLSFFPGGYPPTLGRVAAAAVSVESAEPPADRWHLDVHLDLLKAGALFTTPFDDDRGTLALSFRRSWFDAILPLVSDGLELAYTDYQARVSYRLSPRARVRLTLMGSEDATSFSEGEGARAERVDVALGFHRAALSFDVDLSRCLRWTTRIMGDYQHGERRVTETGSPDVGLDDDVFTVHGLTSLWWRPSRRTALTVGVDVLWKDSALVQRLPVGDPIGEPSPVDVDWVVLPAERRASYLGVAPYLGAELSLAPNLVLQPGLRVSLDLAGDGPAVVTFDPRLAARWTITPGWTLVAMAALAHQPQSAEVAAAPLGAPDLHPIEALQASLGLEWRPDDGWLVSLTGYHQALSHLPRAADAVGDETPWRGDERRRALGIELFVRKRLGQRVHGWVAYTIGRAERSDPTSHGWSLHANDQTHVFNLAASVLLGAEWRLALRFQLASGRPWRAVVAAQYDADGDRFTPIYDRTLSRMPIHHRLDLRVDKTLRFDDWLLQLYLDVQNVYGAENHETITWSYDFARKRGALSLPILPTLGLRMVF